jgi:osomolarity two-component system sensor histidine kinase SLN1
MIESKLFSSFSQTEQGRLQGMFRPNRLIQCADCLHCAGGKGTGLGLAIVRQIVQLSGGRLRVQSRVGLGTTFSVDLPLRLMPLEARPGTPALLRSNSNPLSRPPLLSSYPSPPTSQESESSIVIGGGAVSTPGTFARAKMLADPMLSPLSHEYPNSQLMSLARGQPVQPLQTPEEEAAIAHAASGLHSRPPSSHGATTAEPAHLVLPPPISTSPPPPVAHSVSTPGPRRSDSPSGYGETDAPPSPSFSEGLHVLVVDDDNMTRMLMKFVRRLRESWIWRLARVYPRQSLVQP